jgi:outer membrane protein assembly factor BamB
VYVSSGQLFAVKPTDGSLLWKYPADKVEGNGIYAPAAIGPDIVVVADYSNNLHIVNPKTGALMGNKFSGAKARYIAAPLVLDKVVLAPSADHYLYAIDFQGIQVGKFQADAALWSQPLYDGKTIYQASLGHTLYALDPTNIGKALWQLDLGGGVVSTPIIDKNGILYIGTLANEVLAVDTNTRKIVWRIPTNEGVWTSPVLNDGTLFISTKTGTVMGINSADGKEIWKTDIGGLVTGGGAITPSGIVFTTVTGDRNTGASEDGGDVVMLDFAKGTKIWTTSTKSLLYGSPVSTKDYILVGVKNGDKIIMALDFSGKEIWSLPLPK